MKVLYLAHRVPYPPDKGDRIRNWNVLRQLARHADVSLATLADEPFDAGCREKLQAVCRRFHIANLSGNKLRMLGALATGQSLSEARFHNRELHSTIEQWHSDSPFDACIISASSLVPYVKALSKNVPTIIDVVDVDSQKWYDFAARSGIAKRWLYRLEGRRVRAVECDLARWAAAVTLVSEAETKLFNAIVDSDCAITATNGVDLDYFVPSESKIGNSKTVIAFSGAMDYLPNVDAVTWFAKEVWPHVAGEAEFRIVGRNPVPVVRALAAIPGITVTGGVPDVRPHLAEASIVVVPMRLSRGLQNKVLEALAMGKAVIASPPALAALATVNGEHLIEAKTPQDWIDAIQRLRSDDSERHRLGENGRKFVEDNHNWATCLQPLVDAVLQSAGVPA